MNDLYDDIPYKSRAFAATHPAALATMATLFGLQPTPPERARVLEVGCAAGGNLVPMAAQLPGAHFVGFDLNAASIERGQQRVRELGLPNLELFAADLCDLPDDLGDFDYIIAHGVYSWVPQPVQRALLQLCQQHLTPEGVAYISYNTLPGWSYRQALRHMALFHADGQPTAELRLQQTRALVNLVREATPEDTPLRELLESEHRHFSGMPDWYITHEHLGAVNEALWFHDFVQRAGSAGLQFLGEAELRDMVALDLPDGVRQQVEALGTDQLRLEQYLDFVRHRTFRRTLLVRDELDIQRDITLDRADALHVAGALASQPSDPTVPAPPPEATPEGDPVQAATWATITAALPGSLPMASLVDAVADATGHSAAQVHDDVVNTVFSGLLRGAVQLSAIPLPAGAPSERPVSYRIARDEVARGESWVTNRRHQGVQLDPYMVQLLPLLDGQTDRDAAVEQLALRATDGSFELFDLSGERVTEPERARAVLAEGWPRALDVLAYYALLE